MSKDKSLTRAYEIKNYYVESLVKLYGENIEAVILVGSLSNGSYIAGPGRDIDLITVLKDETDEHMFNQVLEHIGGDPFTAVDETFRVLKEGGIVLHTTCFISPIHAL